MLLAEHIRKLGFRRWHERQLIEAHASLVTAFLGVIMVAVCLDQLHWRDGGVKPLAMLVLAAAGIVLCFKTASFYFRTLFRAEHFAAQAVCEACRAYGVIEITTVSGNDDTSAQMHVRCRKCSHGWTIHAQEPPPAAGTRR
jgi:hypothetical protein